MDVRPLLVLMYTPWVRGSQQYKRVGSAVETHTASVHFLSRAISFFTACPLSGGILEESLIIFTAHSIIPAKRLIHDLTQRGPILQSQGLEGAKGERKTTSVGK